MQEIPLKIQSFERGFKKSKQQGKNVKCITKQGFSGLTAKRFLPKCSPNYL